MTVGWLNVLTASVGNRDGISCSSLFCSNLISVSFVYSALVVATAVTQPLIRPQLIPLLLNVSLHPKGLPPLQAVKAWMLRTEEGLSWPEIQERTTNVLGETAGDKAVREAVARIEAMEDGALVPKTNYGNCGRKKNLPASTERKILEFAKKWRISVSAPAHTFGPSWHSE